MSRLLFEETKKIFRNKQLFLIIFSLIIVNYIYIDMDNNGRKIAPSFRMVYKELDRIDIDDVENKLLKLETAVEDIDFITYSVKEQVDASINYNANIESIVSKTLENLEWSKSHNNTEGIKISEKIIKLYGERTIRDFKYTEGLQRFINNNFSTFLMFLLIVIVASRSYADEFESKVYQIQKPTMMDKLTPIAKSLALLIFCVVICFVFIGTDLLFYSIYSYLGNLSIPLYSISSFYTTPLNLSVLSFVIIKGIFTAIGLWFFALLFSLVSLLTKKTALSILINTILMIFINFYEPIKTSYLNPYNLLLLSNTIKSFEYRVLMNSVILTPYLSLVVSCIFISLLICVVQKVYQSKRIQI